MNVVALLSGGKDSCYSAMKCVQHGHRIVVLANLYPKHVEEQRDSYMYQTQGFELLPAIAECMGLPLERRAIQGGSINQDLTYVKTGGGDEVEDLYELLKEIKIKYPQVNAVCSGAVLSNYQRTRVENVCERLGLTSLAFLWNRDQAELLDEMIAAGVEAVLVKVCSMGLDASHLGQSIRVARNHFLELEKKFGFHVCGEGGEYETITCDCPLFVKGRIVLDDIAAEILENRAFSPICALNVKKFHVERKNITENISKVVGSLGVSIQPQLPLSLSRMIEAQFSVCEVNSPESVSAGPFLGRSIEEAMLSITRDLDHKLDKICMVHLYLANMDDFPRINSEFQKLFESKGIIPPARATVELIFDTEHNIAVSLVLAQSMRSVLQVRSRSEWAPQCIGPYSQATVLDDKLCIIAGQIHLDPATMQLSGSTLQEQLSLCAQHGFRVSNDRTLNSPETVSLIIYLSTMRSTSGIDDRIRAVGELWNQICARNAQYAKFYGTAPTLLVAVPMLPKNATVELEVASRKQYSGIQARLSTALPCLIEKIEFEWTRSFYVPGSPTANLSGTRIPVQALGFASPEGKGITLVPSATLTIYDPAD